MKTKKFEKPLFYFERYPNEIVFDTLEDYIKRYKQLDEKRCASWEGGALYFSKQGGKFYLRINAGAFAEEGDEWWWDNKLIELESAEDRDQYLQDIWGII